MNPESELARLKQQLQSAQALRHRAEGQLQALEQERQAILAEMAELGVSPENLAEEVARLEKEISDLLREAQELIPRELISGPAPGKA